MYEKSAIMKVKMVKIAERESLIREGEHEGEKIPSTELFI